MEDIQLNDIWNILFLILLTHNPKFSFCYLYQSEKSTDELLEFNYKVFLTLIDRFLKDFVSDECLCFVIKTLINYEKFSIFCNSKLGNFDQSKKFEFIESIYTENRSLKYLIWILTRKNLKQHKIEDFQNGKMVREVDLNNTLSFIESTYVSCGETMSPCVSLKELENNVTRTQSLRVREDEKKIPFEYAFKTLIELNNDLSQVFEESDVDEHSREQYSLFPEAGNAVYDQISVNYSQGHKEQKKLPILFTTHKNKIKNNFKSYTKSIQKEQPTKDEIKIFKNLPSIPQDKKTKKLFEKIDLEKKDKKLEYAQEINKDEKTHNKTKSFLINFGDSSHKNTTNKSSMINNTSLNKKFHAISNNSIIKKTSFQTSFSSKNSKYYSSGKSKKKPKKLKLSHFNILKKLAKSSIKKTHVSTLEELDNTNELIFKLSSNIKKTDSFLQNQCVCKLCRKANLRKNNMNISIKTRALQNIKSAEEIKKERINNRLRKKKKRSSQPVKIKNPYIDRAPKKRLSGHKPEKPEQIFYLTQKQLQINGNTLNYHELSLKSKKIEKPNLKIDNRLRHIKSRFFLP